MLRRQQQPWPPCCLATGHPEPQTCSARGAPRLAPWSFLPEQQDGAGGGGGWRPAGGCRLGAGAGTGQGSSSPSLRAQGEAAGREPSPPGAVLWAKCGNPYSLVHISSLPHFPLVTKDTVTDKSQLQHQSCSGFLIPNVQPHGFGCSPKMAGGEEGIRLFFGHLRLWTRQRMTVSTGGRQMPRLRARVAWRQRDALSL